MFDKQSKKSERENMFVCCIGRILFKINFIFRETYYMLKGGKICTKKTTKELAIEKENMNVK